MDKPTFDKIVRAFKIKYIIDGNELEVDEKAYEEFRKTQGYKTYIQHYEGKAITGSTAMKLFGLLDREPKDLDVLDNGAHMFNFTRNDSYFFELDNSYRGSVKHNYGFFNNKEIFVDVFIENDHEKMVYRDIILDHPLSIIKCKFDMGGSVGKHHEDIENMYNSLKF